MRAILSIGEAVGPGPERRRLVSPMRAFLLSFAATLILVGSLFFVLPLGDDADRCHDDICDGPNTQFKRDEAISATLWEIEVWGLCDFDRSLANYKAVLRKDGTIVSTLNPLYGVSDAMTFIDVDGDGCVSVGDIFRATCDPGSTYSLSFIYKESGNERGSAQWYT